MKRQKKRSRDFWLELIHRYESTTNITHKQFALQNDVTLASFQFWLYTFRKPGLSTQYTEHNKEVRFIELAIPAPDKPKQTQVSLFFPAVSKCLDSLPLYRQIKRLGREGLSIPKSSLGDMFHRTAELLKPLCQRMLELRGEEELVNADEIKSPAEKENSDSLDLDILSQGIVTFVYSASRSGKTPESVLKNSTGIIQVDGYTGYNQVCTPENRERAGCLAHVRRYFFKARATFEDEASWALSQILKLYQVEYDAAEKNILGSEQHLLMRKSRSKELMDEFHQRLLENQDIHPPKSQLSSAIQYTLGQWESLRVFLTDARVSLDNNVPERALRTIAVGRKNFLFVGNDKAGESLAIL